MHFFAIFPFLRAIERQSLKMRVTPIISKDKPDLREPNFMFYDGQKMYR